jgi:glycosyltransferase involved in cell wall biosynthesis
LRNIELLELQVLADKDDFAVLNARAYLAREYLLVRDYDKAYENVRYLLDHYQQWETVGKTFLFENIRRIYSAIQLTTIMRSRFSREEAYEKLFMELKKNHPEFREAMLADLHYQMFFDFQEDRFLQELELAEERSKSFPPSALPESRATEAAIYGHGALTAYRREDKDKARHWAEIALRVDPELNAKILQGIIDGTFHESDAAEVHVSACWIAKNEAESIAASILSVKDCADELIVVDTGSTDDTVQIAQECGARVAHFQWRDDFSAARNYALSLAKGDYVIFLDADEHFEPALHTEDRGVFIGVFKTVGVDTLMIPRVDIDAATGEVKGISPYVKIMRREGIHYEHLVHEITRLSDGSAPPTFILEEYRLIHIGYSADRLKGKSLRNIELLEREQKILRDGKDLCINRAYLMREYMIVNNFEKAFENCRSLLDHHEEWIAASKTFIVYLHELYLAIDLAVLKRGWFSRKEVYQKLFRAIKESYPDTRDAMLADLYYQLLFDYREHTFLRGLALIEEAVKAAPSEKELVSTQAEGMVYGRAAVSAYYHGDREKSAYYAQRALQIAPKKNAEDMRALLEGKPPQSAYPGIRDNLLAGDCEAACGMILTYLDQGSLDHYLLEFLAIIAEKAESEVASLARARYETGMALLDEAIELSDFINTGYVDGSQENPAIADIPVDAFVKTYMADKDRAVTPDILRLHALAIPLYKIKGLYTKALRSCLLLNAKGVETENNRREAIRLLREHNQHSLAERAESLLAHGVIMGAGHLDR